MKAPSVVITQPGRFYDGGDPGGDGRPAEPADPFKEIVVVLDRTVQGDDGELFLLRRRIAYDDRHCGEIIVPPVYADFKTDFTSVPALFTWLVPKTGAHLPAALVHDGLVWDPHKESKTYISSAGKEIDRVEADRIFRDGMADTGTPLVRRWLIWTAVTSATMWSRQGTSPRSWRTNYYRWIVPATLLVVGWLGYVATADLFDRTDQWWWTHQLPWMGEQSFIRELVAGLAGAIVIPLLLGVLWGKFRRAGWILGIGVAVLLHVSIALLAITALYVAIEWSAGKLAKARMLWLAGAAVVVIAGIVWVAALVANR